MASIAQGPGEREVDQRAALLVSAYGDRLRVGSILDVGAGPQHVREALGPGVDYTPVDRPGSAAAVVVDLEQDPLPFADGAFDSVLCLDVLEHLDDPYRVFDELCRVARLVVVIALPNPWSTFYNVLRHGRYRSTQAVKYYGLPEALPRNRHKWFFSAEEAEAFIRAGASRNGWTVTDVRTVAGARRRRLAHPLRTLAEWVLFRRGAGIGGLYAGQTWALLEPATPTQSDRTKSA